jgi:hypothetical protein
MKLRYIVIATFGLVVLVPPALADLVTIQATGTLTSVDSPLTERFSVGMPWSLTYTYLTATTDVDSTDKVGGYPQASQGFNLLVGSYELQGTAGVIRIVNSVFEPVQDSYTYGSTRVAAYGCFYVCASFAGEPIGERQPMGVWLSMIDPTGTAFSSDTLPVESPNLAAFPLVPSVDREGNVKFSLEFATEWGVVAYNRAQILGSVSSISIVPLPSAFPLLISAIGLLHLTKRKASALEAA